MPHADMHAELHHDGELLLIEVTMIAFWGTKSSLHTFLGSQGSHGPDSRVTDLDSLR